MMKNDTLKSIGGILEEAQSVAVFPHIIPDGDCIGSAVALCCVLKDLGKDAAVIIEDKMPDYLAFLGEGNTVDISEAAAWNEKPDAAILVDCSEESRFVGRRDYFYSAGTTLCIDHHIAEKGICSLNHIDPGAAATGELMFDLFEEMGWDISPEAANALFAAITSDTGDFQYNNTTKRSHEIVIKLYDLGLDSRYVSVNLYENEPIEKLRIHSMAIESASLFAGGRGIISMVTRDMLEKAGARLEDTSGIVSKLRSIKGVEISSLITEQEDGSSKISFRVKREGDVSTIAKKYGGGGHTKAAGCTIKDKAPEEIKTLMTEEITKVLGE
jgi:phosphoesterase RecJ-like protein